MIALQEELQDLIGATIIDIDTRENSYDNSRFARLHVRYRKGMEINGSREGFYEFWSDEEGNGPGYLAFVGNKIEP